MQVGMATAVGDALPPVAFWTTVSAAWDGSPLRAVSDVAWFVPEPETAMLLPVGTVREPGKMIAGSSEITGVVVPVATSIWFNVPVTLVTVPELLLLHAPQEVV